MSRVPVVMSQIGQAIAPMFGFIVGPDGLIANWNDPGVAAWMRTAYIDAYRALADHPALPVENFARQAARNIGLAMAGANPLNAANIDRIEAIVIPLLTPPKGLLTSLKDYVLAHPIRSVGMASAASSTAYGTYKLGPEIIRDLMEKIKDRVYQYPYEAYEMEEAEKKLRSGEFPYRPPKMPTAEQETIVVKKLLDEDDDKFIEAKRTMDKYEKYNVDKSIWEQTVKPEPEPEAVPASGGSMYDDSDLIMRDLILKVIERRQLELKGGECGPKPKPKGKGKKDDNPWVKHVKEYAKKHNLTYFKALEPAGPSYKK